MLRLPAFFLVFLTSCFLSSAQVQAGPVDVLFQMQADETLEQAKQRAMQQAVLQTVMREALAMLPGSLEPQRQESLQKYLAPQSAGLVRQVSELHLSESVEGMHLGVMVEVDKNALRTLLQRIGVFFTVDAVLPYDLVLRDAETLPASQPEEDAVSEDSSESAASSHGGDAEIQRLELLTGVRREQGAMPRLSLVHENGSWQGGMEAAHGRYDAAGADLETLWFSLWSWYFTVYAPGSGDTADQGDGSVRSADLVVSGWPSTDGVYAFEHVLRSMQPALVNATLKTMAMRSNEVSGVWHLGLRDIAEFKRRMDLYVAAHGLRYELDGGADLPPDSTTSPLQEGAERQLPPAPSLPDPATLPTPAPSASSPAQQSAQPFALPPDLFEKGATGENAPAASLPPDNAPPFIMEETGQPETH